MRDSNGAAAVAAIKPDVWYTFNASGEFVEVEVETVSGVTRCARALAKHVHTRGTRHVGQRLAGTRKGMARCVPCFESLCGDRCVRCFNRGAWIQWMPGTLIFK
ncbi:MAG TPA: hypothetical protein ACQGQG_00770 [Xylella sp.]